jgi:di/tricarboxylate transporter
MFDFAPVGIACAVAGLLFISVVGWRLIPVPDNAGSAADDLLAAEDYVAELVVPDTARIIGQTVSSLGETADENDGTILGLVRKGERLPGAARRAEIRAGDLLVVQGAVDAIDRLTGALGLKLQGKAGEVADITTEMILGQAVVTRDSRLVGRSANDVQMLRASGVSLIGLSRMGKVVRSRIRRTPLRAGDVLLLLGTKEALADAIHRMGCLPLAGGDGAITRHDKAWIAIALFGAAILSAILGLLPLPIALGFTALGLVLFNILPVREIYDAVEWPVIVLLGAMIPLGTALETTGSTALIASALAGLTANLPSWVALAIILVATMSLSDVLNNTATAIIGAPIAIGLAQQTGANPDAYLMAVAIGASCAFLTPIGHKNNMLILGPGGYRFGDYWRMGLPLEIIVTLVAVPLILLVWPL